MRRIVDVQTNKDYPTRLSNAFAPIEPNNIHAAILHQP